MFTQYLICPLVDWLIQDQQGVRCWTALGMEKTTWMPLHIAHQDGRVRDSESISVDENLEKALESRVWCDPRKRDWLTIIRTSGRNPPSLSTNFSIRRRQRLPPLPTPLGGSLRCQFHSDTTFHIMFRPAVRALARAPAVAARSPANTRLISTGPAPKSRSWKNTVARLGLAGGAIYYYNTSSVFSEEPSCT